MLCLVSAVAKVYYSATSSRKQDIMTMAALTCVKKNVFLFFINIVCCCRSVLQLLNWKPTTDWSIALTGDIGLWTVARTSFRTGIVVQAFLADRPFLLEIKTNSLAYYLMLWLSLRSAVLNSRFYLGQRSVVRSFKLFKFD